MLIIGADCHPGFQQIAFVDTETGEWQERRLEHREEAEKFYRDLAAQGMRVEVAQETVRSDQEWRSKYFHLAMRRGRKIAKVAMARRLAVRPYWMWRNEWNYEQLKHFGSHAGQPGTGDGVRQNTELLIGYPAPLHGGVRSSNHDRGCDRRDAWVGPSSEPENGIRASLGWQSKSKSKSKSFNESGKACSSESTDRCAFTVLETADIVREAGADSRGRHCSLRFGNAECYESNSGRRKFGLISSSAPGGAWANKN
jgi:hypothetical protein